MMKSNTLNVSKLLLLVSLLFGMSAQGFTAEIAKCLDEGEECLEQRNERGRLASNPSVEERIRELEGEIDKFRMHQELLKVRLKNRLDTLNLMAEQITDGEAGVENLLFEVSWLVDIIDLHSCGITQLDGFEHRLDDFFLRMDRLALMFNGVKKDYRTAYNMLVDVKEKLDEASQ